MVNFVGKFVDVKGERPTVEFIRTFGLEGLCSFGLFFVKAVLKSNFQQLVEVEMTKENYSKGFERLIMECPVIFAADLFMLLMYTRVEKGTAFEVCSYQALEVAKKYTLRRAGPNLVVIEIWFKGNGLDKESIFALARGFPFFKILDICKAEYLIPSNAPEEPPKLWEIKSVLGKSVQSASFNRFEFASFTSACSHIKARNLEQRNHQLWIAPKETKLFQSDRFELVLHTVLPLSCLRYIVFQLVSFICINKFTFY